MDYELNAGTAIVSTPQYASHFAKPLSKSPGEKCRNSKYLYVSYLLLEILLSVMSPG